MGVLMPAYWLGVFVVVAGLAWSLILFAIVKGAKLRQLRREADARLQAYASAKADVKASFDSLPKGVKPRGTGTVGAPARSGGPDGSMGAPAPDSGWLLDSGPVAAAHKPSGGGVAPAFGPLEGF